MTEEQKKLYFKGELVDEMPRERLLKVVYWYQQYMDRMNEPEVRAMRAQERAMNFVESVQTGRREENRKHLIWTLWLVMGCSVIGLLLGYAIGRGWLA